MIIRSGIVDTLMLLLQLPNEVDAPVNPMGFETRKVQTATLVRRSRLARKVDQFR